MKTVTLDTQTQDGMYMDIESIEFKYNPQKLKEKVNRALEIIKQNSDILSGVKLHCFNNDFLVAQEYYNSMADDDEKTNEVDSRIDTEVINVSPYGVWYRGYSKWTSDFLEVCLDELLTN